MLVKELSGRVPNALLENLNARFTEFREPQELAIKAGLLDGKNLVISSPTASGKTLVAELACLKNVLDTKGKAVYIVPLKSLASEKHNDFMKHYSDLGVNVAISIGDYDTNEPGLNNKDIIICTSEKLDSLVRHDANWVRDIRTIIIDEIHLLNDVTRGPTLEVLLTRLMEMLPHAQIIGLSATVNNADELSEWLGAELVRSNYRPVKLNNGVYYDGSIDFNNSKEEINAVHGVPELDLTQDTLKKNKQALVFLGSRRNAESSAEKTSAVTKEYLSNEDKESLNELSDEVLNALESPTAQCRKLSACVKNGTAFHHAGLVSKQRTLIENAFKQGIIKIITATPTLAYGVNLPAYRVIVRDLKRYSGHGMDWIPVMDWWQMAGRAGRPAYDTEGEAIAVSKSEAESETVMEKYVLGTSENILSKLAVEPVLAMHALSLIASGNARSKNAVFDFFNKTFYAHQYGNQELIERKLNTVIERLISYGFVNVLQTELSPTQLGKRVSELYLNPDSAAHLIDCIKQAEKTDYDSVSFLHAISNTTELNAWQNVTNKDLVWLESEIACRAHTLLEPEPSPWDHEYINYASALKTALIFNDWINEKPDDKIAEAYNMPPGVLRARIANADWLTYSMKELATILGKKELISELNKLRLRLEYGAKEELLTLLRIKGIGRVRARKLNRAGLKRINEVRDAGTEKLTEVLGSRKLAENVMKQVSKPEN